MFHFKINFICVVFVILGQFSPINILAENPKNQKINKINAIKSINSSSGFVQNSGLIKNQFGQTNSKVKYYMKTPNFNLYLNENGFSYEFLGKDRMPKKSMEKESGIQFATELWHLTNTSNQIISNKIDIVFENSLIGIFEKPTNINSIKKVNRISHTKETETLIAYKSVRVNNIYKNIDVEYVFTEKGFKYNFIIHIGGNMDAIRMKVNGANSTDLTSDGFLNIETNLGLIKDYIPLSFYGNDNTKNQTNIQFFGLSKNTFGFKSTLPIKIEILTIDPSPIISYFGDSLAEQITDMLTDENGNIYITGLVNISSSFIEGIGNVRFEPNNDVFIAKFDSLNKLQWVTYFGGELDERESIICLDALKNIYLLTSSNSDSGIATIGAHQPYHAGNYDIVLLKLNNQGQRVWATYSGTFQQERHGGICCDKFGNIVITGFSGGLKGDDTTMTTIGSYPRKYTGGIVQKFNSNGVRLWGVFAGDANDGLGLGSNLLITDGLGNIYGSGYTYSDSNIATLGAFQPARGGGYFDGYIFKLSPNGEMAWSTYFGGNNLDYIKSLAFDKNYNIVAAGFTLSDTGISTNGVHQQYFGGGIEGFEIDGFIIKLDSNGQRVWSTYFGKEGNDYISEISIDSFSNIILGGFTSSPDSFTSADAISPSYNGGGNDGFIAVFNPGGKLKYCTYIGGTEIDVINTISLNKNKIHFAGLTNSNSMFATSGAFDSIFGGSYDGFFGSMIYNPKDDSIENNTIEKNQIICESMKLDTVIGANPKGGNGEFFYKWITSSTNDKIGFTQATGINYLKDYLPTPFSEKRWYKRIVISGTMLDTSNAISISIGKKLKAGFTVNKQIQCLKENQFIFTDTTSGSNSHFWTFGNGDTSTSRNPTIKYKPSIYNGVIVKLISSIDGACSDSSSQTIYIIGNPKTSSISGDSIVMRNNLKTYFVDARNGSTYQWNLIKGISSGNSNLIQIKWKQTGIDTIRVIEKSSGGCFGDTMYKIVQINVPSGLNEDVHSNSFLLFPNPSNGLISIDQSSTEAINLQIIDIFGRTIKELEISYSLERFNIDLRELSSGTYFLIFNMSNGEILCRNIQINKE
jgi:hypothetical protein